MRKITKLSAMLVLMGAPLIANAQTITEGAAFQPAVEEVYSFTPSESGRLMVSLNGPGYYTWNNGWGSFLYSNEGLTTEILASSSFSNAEGTRTVYLFNNLTSGTTYYFSQDQYNKTVSFTFEMVEDGAGIVAINPSTDDPINYVTMAEIQIYGTTGVSGFGTVSFSYGNETVEMAPSTYNIGINNGPSNDFLQIAGSDGAPAFKTLLQTAIAAGANQFTITVTDLKVGGETVTVNLTGEDGVTVNNGTLTLTYGLVSAPVYEPAQSTWPETFYSSWEKGDPTGMATLVFDQDIKSVGEIKVMMGAVTPGGTGGEAEIQDYEVDTYTIDKNKVIIDFTGQEWVSTNSNPSKITVYVSEVMGVDGLPADMTEYGTQLALFQQISYVKTAAPENPDTPEPGPSPEPEPEGVMSELATQKTFEIAFGDIYEAVELAWPEPVAIVDEEAFGIEVYSGTTLVGTLTSKYVNIVPAGDPGIATREDETTEGTPVYGATMYILLGASELIKEEGAYTLVLPEGIVENEDGEVNQEQTLEVTVTGLALGVASPESGSSFTYGQDVVITIAFDGEVEQNYSQDMPLVVTDYNEYDEQFTWTAGVLYIDGSNVVINLGNELDPGTYYVTFRSGQVIVDGVENEGITDYIFYVKENSTGISTIEAALESNKAIYNLNGVKVNKNNLTKGVYIIDGQKVILNK